MTTQNPINPQLRQAAPGSLVKRRRYKTEAVFAKVAIVLGFLMLLAGIAGVLGTLGPVWLPALFMLGGMVQVLVAVGLNVVIDYLEVQLGEQYGQ